jgi:hypothetical protein
MIRVDFAMRACAGDREDLVTQHQSRNEERLGMVQRVTPSHRPTVLALDTYA